MKKRLLVLAVLAAAFIFGGGKVVLAETNREAATRFLVRMNQNPEGCRAELAEVHRQQQKAAQNPTSMIVGKNPQGQEVAMLPPAGNLPTVNLPALPETRLSALPVDTKRPPAPQAPPAVTKPQAPLAPASPQAPKPPGEKAARASTPTPPKNYPRGEVVGDQAKRLYLADQPVGEIRSRKGRLKGELVNVDQNNLHIHIWPGNYLSKIAIPVDRGRYQIAHATGKGWVISPEKTRKIPAGYEPVRIGD